MKTEFEQKKTNIGIVESDVEAVREFEVNAEVFKLLIDLTRQYNDPFGSIVREITSNCVDSHNEARLLPGFTDEQFEKACYPEVNGGYRYYRDKFKDWKERPVEVAIVRNESDGINRTENYWLIFRDFGVGMSPDRVAKNYAAYGQSTKNLTNDLIGGFGLGSKSPFAYTNEMFLTTVFDGIRYQYSLYSDDTRKDKVALVHHEIDKQYEWGFSELRIPIKANNIDTFKAAINHQLKYFPNIKFINCGETITQNRIVFGENYVLQINPYDGLAINTDKSGTTHICFGNCSYAIDREVLYNLQKRLREASIPTLNIAIRFQIGELKVLPMREAIDYTVDGIEDVLFNRYVDAWTEIKNKSVSEIKAKTNSIEEFYNIVRPNGYHYNYDHKTGYAVERLEYFLLKINSETNDKLYQVGNQKFIALSTGYSNWITKIIIDNPKEYCDIILPQERNLLTTLRNTTFDVNAEVDSSTGKKRTLSKYDYQERDLTDNIGNHQKVYYKEGINWRLKKTQKKVAYLLKKYPGKNLLFIQNIFNPHKLIEFAERIYPNDSRFSEEEFRKKTGHKGPDLYAYIVKKDIPNCYRDWEGFYPRELKYQDYYNCDEAGKEILRGKLQKYNSLITNYIKTFITSKVVNWEEVKVPKDFELINRSKENNENTIVIRELDLRNNILEYEGLNFSQERIELEEFQERFEKNTIVWGYREHAEIIGECFFAYCGNGSWHGGNFAYPFRRSDLRDARPNKNFLVHFPFRYLIIAKNNTHHLSSLENAIFIEDLIIMATMEKNRKGNIGYTLIRYVTAKKINDYIAEYLPVFPYMVDPKFMVISEKLHKEALFIAKYIDQYLHGYNQKFVKDMEKNSYHYNESLKYAPVVFNSFLPNIYKMFDEEKLYDMIAMERFTPIRKFGENFKILAHVNMSTIDSQIVIDYINQITGGASVYTYLRRKKKNEKRPSS